MSHALTLETLQKQVPSIFATTAAERCSGKYQHISTVKVVEGLMGEGFVPVAAMQSRARVANKREHTKHLLRFRHMDAKPTVGSGLYPEIVLINSHDGLSSYQLLSGLYRIVCGNGLIAGNTYEQLRIRHQGNVIGDVIEGSYQVINNAQGMLE